VNSVDAPSLSSAVRKNWKWYLPGWVFLPCLVLGQEAAWAGMWMPPVEWILPVFTFMTLFADLPRWRGRTRFRDTILWGIVAPFATGAVVSLLRMGVRRVVGWPV
jgi:hypothetical protein